MSAPEYHLDRVAVDLIERLEGARRTWAHRPDLAGPGLRKAAEEMVSRVVAEHDELFGAGPHSELLRVELLDTFLPRYVHLAIAQNAVEEKGLWPGGDLAGRIGLTVLALVLAAAFDWGIHNPAGVAFFALALVAPFGPELRAWSNRRRYAGALQQAVDDLGRIQAQAERYTLAEAARPARAAPVADPATPHRPSKEHEA